MSEYNLGSAEGLIKIGYDGKGLNQATQGMDDLEKHAGSVRRSFQTVATTTGIAAGAIAAGIGYAVNSAIEFEKRISAIGAVSGATKDQLEILRKKALQLGADTVFSASDAAVAMEELAKAGLSVTDIMGGAADATVALAAAGEIDLPQAATIAANAMNQFGLAAKDLPKVADLIAGAANASAIDVGDFGLAMQQAGAVANLSGLKFQDLAVAIALMGNAGIKGSDAGTSLKTMLQNLIPTTKAQIELSKKLGLITKDGSNAFFDQAGHVKSLAQVAGVLATALKGQTDEQKSLTLQTLFGSDAIRAAAILANSGAAGFDNLANSMAKISAADVAKKRMDNVAGSIEQLKGSVDTAAIALGTALLPIIRKVTDFITLLVNKFSALDPKWQKLIAFAAVAAAALLGLIAVIAGIGAAVAGVAASVAALKVVAVITAIVLAIVAIATAIKLAYDHSQQFRDLIAKLGQVAVAVFGAIMAVVKPIVAFFKNDVVPAIREIVAQLAKNLQPAFAAIGEFIQSRVLPAVNKLKDAFAKVMPTVIAVGKVILEVAKFIFLVLGKALGFIIPLLLNIIGPIFTVLIDVLAAVIGFIPTLVKWFLKLVDIIVLVGKWIAIGLIAPFVALFIAGKWVFEQLLKVVDFFVGRFQAVWGFIETIAKNFWTALMKIIDVFVGAFKAVWGFFAPVVKAVFGLISAIIGLAFDVISGLFQIWWKGVKAVWDLVWSYVIGPVINAFTAITNAIVSAFDWITSKVTAFWNAVVTIWNNIYAWIVPPILTAWNAIVDGISSAFAWVVAKVTAFWAWIRGIWDQVWGWVVVPIVNAFNAVKDWISERMQAVHDDVKARWDAIVKFFLDARDRLVFAINHLTDIVTRIREIFQQMKDKAIEVATGLIDWVKALPGRLMDALGNLGSTLYNSGRALIQGFWDGIKSIWNSMVGWVENKMSGLRDLWPFSPAKRGPFSGKGWVLYSGRALMEGFAAGMDDRAGTMVTAAERALAGVANKLPTDFAATVTASQAGTAINGAAGLGGRAPQPTPASTNTTTVTLNVPLEDLRSITDVQDLLDFVDRLRNDSRRGMEVSV